jgi:hypothetical protein
MRTKQVGKGVISTVKSLFGSTETIKYYFISKLKLNEIYKENIPTTLPYSDILGYIDNVYATELVSKDNCIFTSKNNIMKFKTISYNSNQKSWFNATPNGDIEGGVYILEDDDKSNSITRGKQIANLYIPPAQCGGSKKKSKSTHKRVGKTLVNGKERVVYEGSRGGRYIKKNSKFVRLTK